MEKMELGKSVQLKEGILQTSFNLRDIHFDEDALIVHTIEGNIIPLPAANFTTFISEIRTAVKAMLLVDAKAPLGNGKE